MHDEIDPATREWVTIDESGNAAMMTADEVRAEALAASFEDWLSRGSFNSDQLRVLHLIKENIRANAAELTAFESWRFDRPPLSMYGGFERARAAFGSEEELERILADMNRAVFDTSECDDAAEPRPDKPLH